MPRATAKSTKAASRRPSTPAELEFDMDTDFDINWEDNGDEEDGAEDEERKSKPNDAQVTAILERARAKVMQAAAPATRKKYLGAHGKALREENDAFVLAGNAYIDQLLADTEDWMRPAQAQRATTAGIAQEWDEALRRVMAAVDAKQAVVDELSPLRRQRIDDATENFRAMEGQRQAQLRGLLRAARDQVNGVIEEEQVVADAAAWIRDFKKLLRC
ncbi:hypothetical protein EWM64_g10133 [Hericium alpestre]|uniref:Uncharacterized protein n=1 Tax=Hericium alpestre TaxID=135208 RepID=A0A4Y9ZJP4_9AGAM|nr:hypothetical protein EWM64_g10133 [Hericium alpestre]